MIFHEFMGKKIKSCESTHNLVVGSAIRDDFSWIYGDKK
jgi:hypothetical protein